MNVGIRRFLNKTTDTIITDDVLVTVGLQSPIAANETQRLRWVVFSSVDHTTGIDFVVVSPGVPATFLYKAQLQISATADQAFSTSGSNRSGGLPTSGLRCLIVDALIQNGSTPGVVDLQLAQNTAGAATLERLPGSCLEVTVD